MKENIKKNIIPFFVTAALIAAAACLIIRFGGTGVPRYVLFGIFLILALLILLMAAALRKSLKVTLYSYRNIGLIGGILFAAVLALVMLGYIFMLSNADAFSVSDIYREVIRFPRKFSFYAVFVIFAVCVALGVSNIALIRHEGFRLHNALSVILAALYIGGTVVIYIISELLEKKIFSPQGIVKNPAFVVLNTVIPLFLLLMLCYFECIFAGSVIMGWKAARQTPSYDKDYIIILGCSIDKRGGLLPLLKGRVNRAIRFAWEQEITTGKPLKYVPSGGQGPNEVMSEGSAMELYLKTRGAEDYEVFPEKKSTNTLENMRFSKEIIDGLCPDAKIAFATTNYHMLRSGILARMAGIDAEGIAGDTKWYFWPNGFIREFFGILALKVNAHVTAAIFSALICIAVGFIEYFGIIS